MAADLEVPPLAPSPVGSSSLRARYADLVEGLLALHNEVGEGLALLEKKERAWTAMMAQVESNANAAKSRIDINVGGRVFATTKATLLGWEASYFHALLGSGRWEPCGDGAYFIDRSPQLFERVMEALRTGEPVDMEGLSEKQAARLREECDYFQLPCELSWQGRIDPPRWDPGRCSSNLALSRSGRAVTKTSGGNGWQAVLAAPEMTSFKVRILSPGAHGIIMVGYAKARLFSVDRANHNHSGWFVHCGLGALLSAFGDAGRAYCEPLTAGSLLEASLDMAAGQITFSVNGASRGVAFSSVDCGDGPLFPCVELWDLGASLALED